MSKPAVLLFAALLLLPAVAGAITEEKSGVTYEDEITVEHAGETTTLVATGVALREKTFLKVDVYTIVSWVDASVGLGPEPARTLRAVAAPKRIQMDLRRSFSRDKLVDSMVESIEKNYEDTSAFAADLEAFTAYFDRDAQEGDRIVFDYAPASGLTTELNGEVRGVIENAAFVEALWSVWFGEKPVSGDMRDELLAAVD